MAKQKVSPGGVMDFVTPEELAAHLDSQSNSLLKVLGKNAHFRRAISQEQINAAGSYELRLSPPDGFLWEVRAAVVSYTGAQDAIPCLMYFNAATELNYLDTLKGSENITAHSYSKTIVVHSTDELVFAPDSANLPLAGSYIGVALYVIEVPNSHEAQLLL